MPRVLSLILGGGKGTRLYPLTKERSKPAVPFGGSHRIVDIPISNCINSGFRQIYILTQFNSASLHIHIARAYNMDYFSKGFVEILAAEETFDHNGWYGGTADAVRKNFCHFRRLKPTHYIILSGDQLYRMDLDDFMKFHIESGSDISLAATKIKKRTVSSMGILKIDDSHHVCDFIEKPDYDKIDIDYWAAEKKDDGDRSTPEFWGSMGMYIFNADVIEKILDNDLKDFGHDVIPYALDKYKISSYFFDGYWTDIGTIKNFYDANIDLTSITPKFNFYDEVRPIFTHNRNLPPSKINGAYLNQVITSEGCIITNSQINYSIIGLRSIIENSCYLEGVVCMGADEYETPEEKILHEMKGIPNLGIGANTRIRRAIIDKNARIGCNCSIGFNGIPPDGDYGNYHVKDGIYIILKDSVLENGTVI